MQGLESCAAQLEILPEVMKPLIGQGIAFQAGLGAIPAFGVREDPAAEAGRRRRAEQDLEGGILYIAQKVVDIIEIVRYLVKVHATDIGKRDRQCLAGLDIKWSERQQISRVKTIRDVSCGCRAGLPDRVSNLDVGRENLIVIEFTVTQNEVLIAVAFRRPRSTSAVVSEFFLCFPTFLRQLK